MRAVTGTGEGYTHTNSGEPDWARTLEEISRSHFGVAPPVLLEAFGNSPNARGYVLGSLSELLLQRLLTDAGYQVLRIREKWVGRKLHHGDFYVSRDGDEWFVVESKGLKSNSERWHKIATVDPSPTALREWFRRRSRGEIGAWWRGLPVGRQEMVLASGTFNKARILETHFVSGTGGRAGREIATPRKSEFHVVALDLYLRTSRHEFIFAASDHLESPRDRPQHLKQNYVIDILLPDETTVQSLPVPWTRDFHAVFDTLTSPITNWTTMQVDDRKPWERQDEIEELDED